MSKFYPKPNEESVKWKVINILTNEKGWKLENLYGEQLSLSGKRIADLTCHDKNGNILIVFEIKDKDKDLKKALGEQAVEWAIDCEASIAYATDKSIIKTWFLGKTKREQIEKELDEKNITDRKERIKIMFENGKPLILNGQEVEEFITEELASKYLELDSNEYNTTDTKSIERTHEELIKVFASVNDKLRLGEGLGKGLQRFGEFCNLLFLKLVSEQEEKKEREGGKTRIDADYRWNSFRDFKEEKWLDHLKDTIWKHFQGKYGKDIFTPLKIKNPQTLQEIIRKLNPLSLSEIDVDVKGEAFEYFLKAYSKQKNNDLGEYFTPRHIVKFMVNLANPQFGEKIYDPFCGTGGMLTESYKHIRKWMEKNKESDWDKLQNKTIYGNDINEDSCRVAKMSMILLGDGQTNIYWRDSLNLLKNDYNNEFDMIITNMPFGIGTHENTEKPYCYQHKILLKKDKNDNLRKEIKECLECLELLKAKKSENNEKREKLYKYYLKGLNINDLCVQHCFRAIDKNNPKSRIIMIVPQGILSSEKGFKKLREFIYKNSYVEYIISLPRKVFYADAKASILYLTNINPELKNEEYVKEEKWKERKEQDRVWYYTVENTGFTLNAKREKKEGKNDLEEFQTTFCQIFENDWVFKHEDLYKSLLNEKFYKLEMEEMKKNSYISIPSYYNDPNFADQYSLTSLSKLVKEIDIRNTDKSAPVWSITNDRGFVPSEENFKERVASKDISNYKLVPPNHFAYNPYRINVGSINYNDSKEIGCVSSSFPTFQAIEEKVIPQYLFLLFHSEQFKNKVKSLCSENNTVREDLNFSLFQRIKIPVPSLEEQQKVIEELKKIKENIKNAQKTIDDLNSSLPLSYYGSNTKNFNIPNQEVGIRKLGEVAEFQYGYTAKVSNKGEYRFIQTGDIEKYGNILEQEKKYVDLPNGISENKYLLKKGEIITARHGNCGRTAIFQNNIKTVFTNDLIRISLNQEIILPKYYWYFTKSQEYWEQVNNLIGGTAQPQFNANSLKEIKIPIPSLEKQKSIVQEREQEQQIVDYQKKSITLLKEKEQRLLENIWGNN